MNTRISSKELTKQLLLEAGMETILEKGYNNTGIQEVLDAVNVPKGSFYYYFDSKEDFALQIIDFFAENFANRILRHLRDTSLTPLNRLKSYCQTNKEMIVGWHCRKGCLIGNLSQEMADQSESLRGRLENVMSRWRDLFAACIAEGQAVGEIPARQNAHELAEFFLSGWEGAVMRAKSTRSEEPMNVFIKLMFEHVLSK